MFTAPAVAKVTVTPAREAASLSPQTLRRHPIVTGVLIAMALLLIAVDAKHRHGTVVIAFFVAVVLGALIADWVIRFFHKQTTWWIPVNRPGVDLVAALVVCGIEAAWLVQHFDGWRPGFLIPSLVGGTCMAQIPLALFLLLRGYRPKQLGISLRGVAAVPLIMICCLPLAAWAAPLRATWSFAYQEVGGSPSGLIVNALLFAALPEEFLRMVLQTRIGVLLNNRAAGWLLASFVWASLHIPKYAVGSTAWDTFTHVLVIVPFGLLLGYITERSQSIVPSVLLHSTRFLWLGALGWLG